MSVEPEFESTGNAELDERLSKPVLRGDVGVDAAQLWMSGFLIVMAGLLVWSGGLRVPFQALDRQVVRDNSALHSVVTLPAAALDGAPQPLALFTLALNWAIAPGSAGAMRLTGLLLHLLNAALVFLISRRLLPKAPPVVAMLAGMLFVLHPMASQSLMYIAARGQVLAATFALISVLLFMRAVRDESNFKPGALAASVVLFILAAFADSSAALIPVLLLSIHWAGNNGARAHWRVHLPFWASLGALAVYTLAEHGLRPPHNLFAQFAQYARMSVAPYGLSIVHDTPAAPWLAGAALLAAAMVAIGLMLLRRSVGGVALLWLVAGLIHAAWAGPAVIEHRAYLALAGACLLAPWLMEKVKPTLRPAAGIAAAALVLLAGAASFLRIGVWRDEFSLWHDAAAKAPRSAVPLANLGRIMTSEAAASMPAGVQGQGVALAAEAEHMLREAIERDSASIEPRFWLAVALQAQGNTDDALQACYDVLRLDLDNRRAAVLAADLLFEAFSAGSADAPALAEAVELYTKADGVAPLDTPALARLGVSLSHLGQLQAAEAVLRRAIATEPGNQALAQSLNNVKEALARGEAVHQQAMALLSQEPPDPAGFTLAAQVNVMRGNILGASYALDKVWQSGGADFHAWLLTGYVWARLDAVDNFVARHAEPPSIPDGAPPPWLELARMCAGSGFWEAAEFYLRSDPALAEHARLPLVRLADIAKQLNQPQRAAAYLQKAGDEDAASPEPWLAMAELAGENQNLSAAANALAEAKKRGADDETVRAVREKFGIDAADSVRTVIR